MSKICLEAEPRADIGKGASRRLRRLENKIPAVVYGGHKPAESMMLSHNKVSKALETESIYSSVFDLKINGKVEKVILKALQRHPYKPVILHMDLQRVVATDVLIKMIPLHFLNADDAQGVKDGGIVNHTMSQVEVRCQAKDLPEFIEVDLADMALNDVIHLSNLKMPKGVQLALDPTADDHDHPVVSIHLHKVEVVEEEVAEDISEEDTQASADEEDNGDTTATDGEEAKDEA